MTNTKAIFEIEPTDEILELLEMAKFGTLPKDFNDWELNFNGFSVAHMAARYNNLPINFNKWEICDSRKWSVAHEAAENGNLPENFNRWTLIDNRNKSVILIAFRRQIDLNKVCLPQNKEVGNIFKSKLKKRRDL